MSMRMMRRSCKSGRGSAERLMIVTDSKADLDTCIMSVCVMVSPV